MYNPAGTVKLSRRFYPQRFFTVRLERIYQNVTLPEPSHTGCTTCESDEPSYIPGIFGVYNKEKWSLYAAFSNVAGGGKVDFGQGNWTTIGGQGLSFNRLAHPLSRSATTNYR